MDLDVSLKPCPFCGTKAVQRSRQLDNATGHVTKVICGNPFCHIQCQTIECASAHQAVEMWNERAEADQLRSIIGQAVQLIEALRVFGNDNVHRYDVSPWLEHARALIGQPRRAHSAKGSP